MFSLYWFKIWTRGAGRIVRDVGRRHLSMRIRVRVAAPGEKLRYARYASGFACSYRSRTQDNGWPQRSQTRGGDGVVDRLGGRVRGKTPAQPVNNAGEAIQIFNLPYRRFVIGWTFGEGRRQVSWARGRIQFCDTADWKSALRARRMITLRACPKRSARVRSHATRGGFDGVPRRAEDSKPDLHLGINNTHFMRRVISVGLMELGGAQNMVRFCQSRGSVQPSLAAHCCPAG